MQTIFVLDRYTSKYLAVKGVDEKIVDGLKPKDKVVYSVESHGKTSLSIGEYLGYKVDTDRFVTFDKVLEGADLKYFDEQQEYALSVFPTFKKMFKESFAGSRPITARYHIYGHQVYFYFYAEERYVFGDFVRNLREKVGKNIFLFQVGARDMVRLSPSAKDFLTIDGRPLPATMNWPITSVPMENIPLQNLDGRDVERLKGWSGKLKEDIGYETELYLQESKKYPVRGSKVDSKELKISGICLSYNIMNGDVTVKTKDNEIFRIPVTQLQFKEKNPGRLMIDREDD